MAKLSDDDALEFTGVKRVEINRGSRTPFLYADGLPVGTVNGEALREADALVARMERRSGGSWDLNFYGEAQHKVFRVRRIEATWRPPRWVYPAVAATVALAVFGLARLWTGGDATVLQVKDGSRVEYLLAPLELDALGGSDANAFRFVEDHRLLLHHSGGRLSEISKEGDWGRRDVLPPYEMSVWPPGSVAADGNGALIGLKGRDLFQFSGGFARRLPNKIPTDGKLLSSSRPNQVYLVASKDGESVLFLLDQEGGVVPVLSLHAPDIVDLAENAFARYVATSRDVHRTPAHAAGDQSVINSEVLFTAPSEEDIVSVAVHPEDQALYVSTTRNVYEFRSPKAETILFGTSGELRYGQGGLLMLAPREKVLIQLR